jgi:glycosyltransferase involved in cell wall biosynthesis
MKLAIVSTHPIQYNAPWFRLLAQRGKLSIKVFYTWSQSSQGAKYDPGFGRVVQWDIPLLEGYDHTFVENTAPEPGTHHFRGIRNPSLIKEVTAWKPDALLVFGWSFDSHLKCLRHFHGRIPILFRGDSTLLDDRPGMKQRVRRLFLRWVYSHIDYALYAGIENRKYFEACGLKNEKLVFAPHAIDNQRFAQPAAYWETEAHIWRQQLGLTPQDLIVLFAGKLEPKKNPAFLLGLAERLNRKDIKFILVGNGILEIELKNRARGNDQVIFLDFQNQQRMPVVYRLGDIFLLPSEGPGETWGLAVNEAMACRLPVMVSKKAGCAADLVQPGVNGIVFPPGATGECADFLKSIAGDKGRLKDMNAASGEKIRSYSFERIVEAIEGVVQKINA